MTRTFWFAGAAMIAALASATAAGAQAYSRPFPVQPAYGAAPGSGGQCGPGGCGTPGPVGFGPGQITNEDYPPNAAPGQCFTKVLVPEVTESFVEHVLVSPEKTEIKVIPGASRVEEKQVLVKEETVELISIPATYRSVTETVVVRAAYTRTETIPAAYETVSEQVKVKDGYTAWRPGALVAGYAPGAANSYGAAPTSRPEGTYGAGVIEHNPAYGGMTTKVLPTGEVLCLVVVPPEYKTITKQVLKTPARTQDVQIPAETRVITRQVVDQAARVERRVIPAVYETVRITVRAPDTTQPYTIPAVYNDYTKTRIVTPSRFEWKQVDCRTDVIHAEGGAYGAPSYAPPPRYTPQPVPYPSGSYGGQ